MTDEKNNEQEDKKLEEVVTNTDVVNETNALNEEYEQLEQKVTELEDQNLRLQAEIQNILKRNQRDREQMMRYRSQDLATAILPVMDNLERALEIKVQDESGKALKDGIQMVYKGFITALESQGVTQMDSINQSFDPNYHEAYTTVEANEDQESGMIAEVFEKGYMIHDRILRAAKVAVTN